MAGASGNADKSIDLSSPAIVSRLPTFKGPRDLTLSAAARARRQYVPNIPPKRDRGDSSSAPPESSKSSSKQFVQPSLPGPSELKSRKPPRPNTSPGLGIHGGRGGSRGRGSKPELVQSASIFAEGVGVKSLTSKRGPSSFSSAGRGRGRGRGSSGGGGRPSISTADLEDAISKKSKAITGITQDDIDIDDDDSDEDPIGGSGTFIEGLGQGKLPHSLKPVSLPLDAYFTKLSTKSDGEKIKPKKAVPGDSFAQYLKSAPKGTLSCIQMPYLLPFKQDQKNSAVDTDSATKTYANNLTDVKGGCIGKIQIRRSGKCYLILGTSKKDQIKFGVEPSKIVGFRQELAAIDTEKRSLSMLGKVQHKFVCTPDLGPLLK